MDFFIPVLPVPASRPRVTQYGTYFTKNYNVFREDCKKFLKTIAKKYPTSNNLFEVHLEFICYKPKTPTNEYPRGDCDNFLKGPLDCITQSKMIWEDDVQITSLTGVKRYQDEGEPYGIKVKIIEYI